MRRLLLAAGSFLGILAAPVPSMAAEEVPGAEACNGCEALLELAASSPLREKDRARDIYRHPVETLTFFGVAPTMKVGEYAPGGEWYSRFLGLYLGKQGKLVGLYFNPDSPAFKPQTKEGIAKGVANFPTDAGKFTGLPVTNFSAFNLGAIPEGEKGTFDRILVIRMMHNMMEWKNAQSEFAAMGTLLKPGGMLGIVQHRAKADAPDAYVDGSKGYLREADVIAFMKENGFDLVRKSEVNANPKDSANWPGGVWTLPPTLALKEQDRDKYMAVGESDRMTLLFRKRG